MNEIKAIAMPGTHKSFLEYFKKQNIQQGIKILDLGAGHGAFTKKLHEMGFNVAACDLFPEHFYYKEIECKKVDITQDYPYEDSTFDLVIAVEVSEHILDHEKFFSEISRILKKDGKLYLSTPNIMSLKSRFRYLFKGFFYSFKPLEMTNYNGLQHVASMTLDQYNYAAIKNGFKPAIFEIDKEQKSSKFIYFILLPIIKLIAAISKFPQIHNNKKLLLGRLLFLCFENNKK
jgi:SAM-dependent methyltransferase